MKPYVKPELFYESFVMSQQIAVCAWDINSAEGACVAYADINMGMTPDWNIFAEAAGCVLTAEEAEKAIGYCYFHGSETKRLHNS